MGRLGRDLRRSRWQHPAAHAAAGLVGEGVLHRGLVVRFFRARHVLSEIPHEAAHLAEVLVALGVGEQPGLLGVDARPAQRGLGQQDVGRLVLQPILQQAVREHDVGAGRLAAAAHHLPEELAVVSDDLEVEAPDATAGPARAALVGRELALPGPERREGVLQHVEQRGGGPQGAVGSEREHRVALHLLDLQGR